MEKQAQDAAQNDEGVMIVGDFNCRVGGVIKGNQEKVSKGGKKLLKLVEKENLVVANSLDLCEGTWTREEGNSRSVLDYILLNEELKDYVTEMKIYE